MVNMLLFYGNNHKVWDIGVLVIYLILVHVLKSGVYAWPKGTFGLPMPKTGCPVGLNIDWETGTRVQKTEKGSHASENIHLAGLESYGDHIAQLFCMKMSFPEESEYTWMPGKYCILKKGSCPEKFLEGYIYWDDAARWFAREDARQSSKGVLPDGDYDQNTKIYYCCRNDGSASDPIQLPSSAPFYLYKLGEICQEVENMYVAEEWVHWSDEASNNLNMESGVYPQVLRNKFSPVFTKLFYCYYSPKPPNKTMETLRMAIIIIVGITAGLIVITIIICVSVHVSKHCHRHRKRADSISDPSARPSLTTSGAMVDCHYVSLQTNDATTAVTPSAPPTELDNMSGEMPATPVMTDDSRPMSFPPSYEEVVGFQPDASKP